MNKYKLRYLCEGVECGPMKSNNEGNLPKLCGVGGGGGVGVCLVVVRADFPEEIICELKPEGQVEAN